MAIQLRAANHGRLYYWLTQPARSITTSRNQTQRRPLATSRFLETWRAHCRYETDSNTATGQPT